MQDLFSMPPAASSANAAGARIRVGIGGWTYAPWRGGVFYPEKLVQRRELEYASGQLTAIEINGTYYGTQKPATYAKWRDATPPGFVFAAKAPQRIMASRRLAGTGTQVEDFVGGIAELGDRLGALLWQFDRGQAPALEELDAFLALLPGRAGGRPLRHALELRDHALFSPQLLALLRARNVALVFAGSAEHPSFADLTADFAYARLMQSQAGLAQGYPAADLDAWACRARDWAGGGDPDDLPHLDAPQPGTVPREAFVFFIAGAKQRNPAAAQALIARLRVPA
ncbi:hypothetical protein B1992_03285 [Pseudoxanthomonas broegbernensis]|uniref:DUF72 domain-containing protein n=1 Tax=Pseudoxanthomonas broegbernensis TaxID=83619 RepID=A0A7V8K7X1_9GAMM|nr:DUF72 domain-containing protein [Pseudoxanthomonas broegbernensis]KAF1687692.1 hypothetical protein B1992_03285 [Pseudoxanthomonas broegbernensis]MBB6064721.1 uncharacterized protein YecE (DUF72 family) [Pseudoxanthomonas broegbernensis]